VGAEGVGLGDDVVRYRVGGGRGGGGVAWRSVSHRLCCSLPAEALQMR
jgi:hypothetical protein